MKQIFEFDTCDENYDYHEHQTYVQAPKMAMALSDIQDRLKEWWEISADVPADEIVDTIEGIIRKNGVDMKSMGY